MAEVSEPNQSQLEQQIRQQSPETDDILQELEQEKVNESTPPLSHFLQRMKSVLSGKPKEPHRTTHDFIKHSGHVTGREKRHIGRGQHPQHEEQRAQKAQTAETRERHQKLTLQEALTQGLIDYKYGDQPLPGELEHSEVMDVDRAKREYSHLFEFIDDRPREPQSIERYLETEDKIVRLKLLAGMPIADAALAVLSSEEPGTRYLTKKLNFYRDFIEGKAIRTNKQWDYNKGKYIQVDEPISAEDAHPENIATGLRRNILYAEMKGTPELAAFDIALRRVKNQQNNSSDEGHKASTEHMPNLFGYHSEIYHGSENIGAYPVLREVYRAAYREVTRSKDMEDLAKTDPQKLEHEAVLLAAKWYTKAMEYNNTGRSQGSPYSSMSSDKAQGLRESIAWARLGEPVQRQLRGMRQKIRGVDLHNIGRFIGKAGDDQYGRELRKIHWQLEHLPSEQTERDEWVLSHTAKELTLSEKQFQRKQDALIARFERRKANILSLELPEEERTLQLESLTAQHQMIERTLSENYLAETHRLRTRTPEQLIEELKAKQEVLKEKHERHKSLAQKAVDLHFAFQSEKDQYGHSTGQSLEGVIDWINYTPLGTINRAHKALQRGVSQETVIAMSIIDILLGNTEINRVHFDRMRRIVEQAKQEKYGHELLQKLVRVGSMLKQNGVEVPLDVIKDIAGKRHQGLHKALKEFSIGEIQESLDKGLNLYVLTAVKRTMREHGHELTTVALQELAGQVKDYRDDDLSKWLSKSLDRFGLDDTKSLISSDSALEYAVQVADIAKGYGHNLPISEVISIAGYINHDMDIENFSDALRHLSLDRAKDLLRNGVTYSHYSEINSVLIEHQVKKDFKETVQIAVNTQGYELSTALKVFSMDEIERFIGNGVRLSSATDVRKTLEGKSISYTFEQLSMLAKNDTYRVTRAIERFGFDTTLYLVENDVSLYDALNVVSNNTLQRLGIPEKPEIISIMARHKNGEKLAEQVVGAGFSVEEIIQYPFLLSSLISEIDK